MSLFQSGTLRWINANISMAVNLKGNVPKATIYGANLIGRFTSLYHAGHGHLVAKIRNLCECAVDGYKGKGWHFGLTYDDGAIGCATLYSVREKLVPLAAAVAPETPTPVVAKKWKSHEIEKLNWLVELETQVKIGDSIYTGIVEKLCHCKRKEIVENGWHFHIKYADGDQGCACVEDVRAGVIDTTKIPQEEIPSPQVSTPGVIADSLEAFKIAHSGQDSVEKKLPEYEKPVKVAVADGRKKTTKKVDTPKTRSRRKRSASKQFLLKPEECNCDAKNCSFACATVTTADVRALRIEYMKGKSFEKLPCDMFLSCLVFS